MNRVVFICKSGGIKYGWAKLNCLNLWIELNLGKSNWIEMNSFMNSFMNQVELDCNHQWI